MERIRRLARSPAFRTSLDIATSLLLWLVVSLVAIAAISDPPYLTLGLGLLGGIFMGVDLHRSYERRSIPASALEDNSRLHVLLHWAIVGLIGLNYAWFVFADRPPLLGLLPLAALLILRIIGIARLFTWTPHDLPIVLLVLLTGVSALVISVDRSLSLPKLYGLLLSVLAYYEVAFGARLQGNLRLWLIALGVLGIAMAGMGLLGSDWFSAKIIDLARVYAFIPQVIADVPRSIRGGFHPNGVAGTLIFVMPLYAVQVIARWQERNQDRSRRAKVTGALNLVALGTTAPVLLLTQSRGALLGLGIASVALFFAWKRRWLLSVGSMVGLVALVAVLLVLFPDLLRGVGVAQAGRDVESSFAFRLAVWRAALQVLQAFPFTGVGIGTFDTIVRLLFPHLYPANPYDASITITHAHNELLQVAIDLGIPGFVAYVALLSAFARTAWRAYTWAPDERIRRIVLGLGGGMLAHQLFGLTDAFMLGTKPGIVMWILMGLVTGLYLRLVPDRRARSQHPSPPAA